MKRLAVLLLLAQLAAIDATAHALPRRALELANSVTELQERVATRGRALQGEADDLAARLSELAGLVPEDRLDLEPELVAFMEKGYGFLYRISTTVSATAAESELKWRALLGGDERPLVKREIGGATVVVRGDPNSREVALTFDDGPCAGDGHRNGTAALLDLLKRENVRATFFCIGECAMSYPALVKRIFAEGHALGNHTRSHARLKGLAHLADDEIVDEVETGESQILYSLGSEDPLILFRCPYGDGVRSERVNSILAKNGFYDIFWTIDTLDWKTHDAATTTRRVLSSSYLRGGIALFHERVPGTTMAVKRIIDGVRQRGYRLVTVPQLLGVDNESSARVAYREAAGLYMSGDKSGAMQHFLALATDIGESVLADDALHYAWLIAMETKDVERAARIRDALVKRFPQSLYVSNQLRVAQPARLIDAAKGE
ncbi:MAG: polysaccharide deacetylase family protein [Candidatus Wallbacteria bacterium]|nr:polysaccharide deacetylase family protein [Candidatus Wallbacteria bacterium]